MALYAVRSYLTVEAIVCNKQLVTPPYGILFLLNGLRVFGSCFIDNYAVFDVT